MLVSCWNPAEPAGRIARQKVEAWQASTESGNLFDLEKAQGRWVVCCIWAGWNAASLRQLDQMHELEKTHDSQKMLLVSVELTDWQTKEALGASPKESQLKYPHLALPIHALPQPIRQFETIPTIWIIDPEGYAVGQYSGYTPASFLIDELKAFERQAAAEH